MNKPKTPTIRTLIIKNEYDTYQNFFVENEELIYKEILLIFKSFRNTRKRKLTLQVFANILDMDWKADIHSFRDETILLERDFLPFFERNEDYETCEEIKSLIKELTKTK